MLKATIDLGTNTCLLLIVEWDQKTNRPGKALHDEAKVVRLGEGVDAKRELQPNAMNRALECLRDYSEKINSAGLSPADTICVATSQARDAKNSGEFFQKIVQETGLTFAILSGEAEAHATFVGALLPGMAPENSAVIDIGGGSTEVVSLGYAFSIDCGAVRLTERYLKSDPVTEAEFMTCQSQIDTMFGQSTEGKKKPSGVGTKLVAVAGTATTLAAWYLNLKEFSAAKIDGLVLSRSDIQRMVEQLKSRTLMERQALPGMEPGRADVLLAGALILARAMELFRFAECQVSTRGLRYGVLLTEISAQRTS